MQQNGISELPVQILDALPNPVLVKDGDTRYVWVNQAFERLFGVTSEELAGKLDTEFFQDRQAAQCNGGDLRVLASGEVDEAEETVIDPELGARQTITRKSRVTVEGKHYLVGVMHDVTDVVEANKQLTEAGDVLREQATELRRLATTDPLTGCLNRRALFDMAAELAPGNTQPVGLIVADLDNFKAVNDTHGHDGGDAVLTQFVSLVRTTIRPMDVVARLGGEEFAVFLPGAGQEQTLRVAQRICQVARANPVDHEDGAIPFTVSVGAVSKARGDDTDIHELIKVADLNLYQAKEQGRDQAVF